VGGPNPTFNSIPPLMFWSQSVVPTGVTFYRGDLFPEWKNDLFVCHWKTGELHHFKLNGARTAIASHTIIQDSVLGASVCHLDVETGTGGALYFFRNDESDPSFQYRDIYRITRDATVYASTFSASPPNPSAGSALTYDMRLVHYGTQTTTFTLTAGLPLSTALALDSLQAASGQLTGSGTGVTWTGSILPNTTLTATYRVTVSDQIVAPTLLTNVMHVASNRADPIDRVAIAMANGQAAYLPIVLRSPTP
jgi:hypothetical protein